ncbi:MAG: hypothetical protein ACO1QS_08370 [Verrucomicrobiota bacterium]
MTYTASRDNEVKNEKKWLFRFSFKDGEWNARAWDPLDGVSYDESGFQEDAVYTLRAFPSKGNPAVATYTAIVTSGPVPRDDQSMVGYLWFAFGSSSFFSEKKAGLFEPVWQMGDPLLNDSGYKLPAFWELREGTPKVPAKMTYISDGFARFMGNGRMQLRPVQAPYDKGYTNAVFFGEGNLTQNGISFPVTSVFRNYYVADPSKDGEPARLLVRTEIKAEISEMKRKVSLESMLPQFKGQFNIQDRRARLLNPDVPTVIYSITNGNWPSLSYVQEVIDKKKRGKALQDLR